MALSLHPLYPFPLNLNDRKMYSIVRVFPEATEGRTVCLYPGEMVITIEKTKVRRRNFGQLLVCVCVCVCLCVC